MNIEKAILELKQKYGIETTKEQIMSRNELLDDLVFIQVPNHEGKRSTSEVK